MRKPWTWRQILLSFTFWLVGACFGAMVLPIILAGDIYEYQDTFDGVHLPPVDAIVCLAGGKGRIALAGDIWHQYRKAAETSGGVKTPLLYVAGMGPQSAWVAFNRQLRAGVRQEIHVDQVILETESTNTESNALWVTRYAEKRGWKHILLVTSAYHMKRASFIFEHVFRAHGLDIQVHTVSAFMEPFGEGEWRSNLHGVHVTVMEYLKWIYYKYFWTPRS